ncbi:MAG: YncE family protein [Candidatus Dormibacteria bacterium]
MSDDVDVIAETLTSRPLTQTEEATLARVEQFVSHHDFAAQQRPRLALEILMAGVVAAVAVTLIVALTHPSLPTPSPAHHTPVPTATVTASPPTPSLSPTLGPTIPLRITQQLSLGRSANAISVSPGIVWVAAQGLAYGDTGRLLRVDASSARQTGSWPVGGDPEAVSASGSYVWVANSFGDGSRVLPDQNTVMQFNAVTGTLVHLYRITSPIAMVANGNGALVMSWRTANGPTDIYLLTAGRSSPVATVPGVLQGTSLSAEAALAVCGGQVYLGVSELSASGAQSINIYVVRVGGGPVRTIATIQGEQWPAMSCGGNRIYVFDGAGDLPVVVNLADGKISTVPGGSGASAAAFESGLIWQLHNTPGPTVSPGYLTALDPNTGLESSSHLAIPGTASSEVFLLAPGAPGLWVVGGNETLLLHVTFG